MAHILIADDDELVAEIASQVLIDAGHACGWVTSAGAAWTCLTRKRPDLLLLDQAMPGESGISLLRRLRQSPKFYDLPVMMLTAMAGEQDQLQAIYAGANEFMSKPFEPARLVSRVQRIFQLRSGRPRHVDLRAQIFAEQSRAPVHPEMLRSVL